MTDKIAHTPEYANFLAKYGERPADIVFAICQKEKDGKIDQLQDKCDQAEIGLINASLERKEKDEQIAALTEKVKSLRASLKEQLGETGRSK